MTRALTSVPDRVYPVYSSAVERNWHRSRVGNRYGGAVAHSFHPAPLPPLPGTSVSRYKWVWQGCAAIDSPVMFGLADMPTPPDALPLPNPNFSAPMGTPQPDAFYDRERPGPWKNGPSATGRSPLAPHAVPVDHFSRYPDWDVSTPCA